MVELWFDPNHFAWIPGACVGLMGGIVGSMGGICAQRGKLRSLTVGLHVGSTAACVVLLLIGIAAWISGQPRGIWYGFGYPGLLGAVIFGALLPVT